MRPGENHTPLHEAKITHKTCVLLKHLEY